MPTSKKPNNSDVSHEVDVEGHLIDSMILTRIWDTIMDLGGDFETLEFKVGKRKTDYSYVRMAVKGQSQEHLNTILQEIYRLGAVSREISEAKLEPAFADGVAPDDFYSSTNNATYVYRGGSWIEVRDMMMDKVVIVDPKTNTAICKPIAELKKGELVVVGESGLRIRPPERPRGNSGIFQFMASTASSEKPAAPIIRQIAHDMYKTRREGGKAVFVVGPAVVHTGSAEAFSWLVREGYVNALLAGNALAVHDVESALYGTSLGVSLTDGKPFYRGHRNHMAAINEIFKAGSLVAAVKDGVLKRGIMFECISRGVPYALAGSIRDDGPLPDVISDVLGAQRRYKELLRGAEMVVMLGTMLHSIAVGNMLPAEVKIVCVDINLAAVTKLLDRGTSQAIGVVSDIGTFLPLLVDKLSHHSEGQRTSA